MKFMLTKGRLLATAGLLAAAAVGFAQVERLDLPTMIQRTGCEGTILGKIVKQEVFRTDVPNKGLFFTQLTVEGTDLVSGLPKTIEVKYIGGFISPNEGAYNSEAPHADDVKVGNEVLIFHKFEEDMGNGVSGHTPYAWHGGVYRVVDTARNGKVVLGRGTGYAVSKNWKLGELKAEIARICSEQKR
jgi:hypothetical protein